MPEPTTVLDEIKALGKVVAALDSLDPAARQRSLRWLADRYDMIWIRSDGGDPS